MRLCVAINVVSTNRSSDVLIGLLHVYNTERLNELSQELDNLYSLYAGKKVKTRFRDLYNVHKRVIRIDIFRGVSLITVCIK